MENYMAQAQALGKEQEFRQKKQDLFDTIHNMLGGGMVDVELDPVHYETALSNALGRYRQLSSNAVEEAYFFMELIPDVNKYTLPQDIIEVHKIHRMGVGQTTGSTEPFQLAQTNTYLLSSTNSLGGLATFDFHAQYKELAGRMFGSNIEFVWNRSKREITILQRPRNQEQLMLKCWNYRPTWDLLDDYLATEWLKDYSIATAKMMIGQARSKFASIAGPQGGGTLNGDALKAEAQAELEKLDQELMTAMSGGTGYGFTIG
jgi:hypothetical protein